MASSTTSAANETLEVQVERSIRQRTFGRIQRLQVAVHNGHVIVSGSAPTYYVKQLAIEAARWASQPWNLPLRVDIGVT